MIAQVLIGAGYARVDEFCSEVTVRPMRCKARARFNDPYDWTVYCGQQIEQVSSLLTTVGISYLAVDVSDDGYVTVYYQPDEEPIPRTSVPGTYQRTHARDTLSDTSQSPTHTVVNKALTVPRSGVTQRVHQYATKRKAECEGMAWSKFRALMMKELIEMGVNKNTAGTQLSAWKRNNANRI